MIGCQSKSYRLRIRWTTKGKGTSVENMRLILPMQNLGGGLARSSDEDY